jgi:hypothetical protein
LLEKIQSSRRWGLKRLFDRGDRSQAGRDLLCRVENIPATLDAAYVPKALDLPGYRLHQLEGARRGTGGNGSRELAHHFSGSRTQTLLTWNGSVITKRERKIC